MRKFSDGFGRLLFCLFTLTLAAHAENNLIRNGTFDEGETTAQYWEPANGLTTFYIKEPGRERIVMMNTQVERKQALAWQQTFQASPTSSLPKRILLPANSYASIGANEGVMLDSDLIDCQPNQNYRLQADVKGVGHPIIWIKGFLWHPTRKIWVDGYQTRLVPDTVSTSAWHTCSIGFNPTAQSPRIQKIKVRLYAYWPNGQYYFDQIKIEPITAEEMAEHVRQRNNAK